MKILITGGSGYVAQSMYNALSTEHDVELVGRSNFDLTDLSSTCDFFNGKYFDVVIHAAVVGGHRLIPDSAEVIKQNVQMYWNLIYNKSHFGKFITFGSGAELGNPTSYYGISKKIIADLIYHNKNFLNLRIFAVFDENELSTRFIKSNLQRYINKEDIIIHSNITMDFFYMEDLVKLVKHYLSQPEWEDKVVDCVYSKSPKLVEIANYINTLDTHTVNISVGADSNDKYTGIFKNLFVSLEGLEKGIYNTYNKLKNHD